LSKTNKNYWSKSDLRVHKFLKKQEQKVARTQDYRNKRRKELFKTSIIALLTGALLTTVAFERKEISSAVRYNWRYNFISKQAVEEVCSNPSELIEPIIKNSENTFADYDFENLILNKDATFSEQELKVACMIHQYNNDYWGEKNNLTISEERILFTIIKERDFLSEDLSGIKRSLVRDSTKTLEELLIEKTTNQYMTRPPYENPRIIEILQEKKLYENKISTLLNQDITGKTKKTIRKICSKSNVCFKSTEELSDYIIYQLSNIEISKRRMNELVFLMNRKMELEEELNIRLALTNMRIAKDKGAISVNQMLFFLIGDYEGLFAYKQIVAQNWNESIAMKYHSLNKIVQSLVKKQYQINQNYQKIQFKQLSYKFQSPIKDPMMKEIGDFGTKRTRKNGSEATHTGIDLYNINPTDLRAKIGTPVYPAAEGYIKHVDEDEGGYGNIVILWHDGKTTTIYGHLQNDEYFRALKEKQLKGELYLTINDRIGSVGTTGNIPMYDEQYGYPHLHFECQIGGIEKNPLLFLNQEPKIIRNLHQ